MAITQNAKYRVDDTSSIFNMKENVNKFFTDLSNTQIYNYVSNGSFNKFFYTNKTLKSWNFNPSLFSGNETDYNLEKKWLKSTINASGYISQELSAYMKPKTEYTVILYSSSSISGMTIEISASNSNQIQNLEDLTQVNRVYTNITVDQFSTNVYKHKLNFKTSDTFNVGNTSVILRIKNESNNSGFCLLQSMCVYQGSIEVSYIDKVGEFNYVVDDNATADPDILWSSYKIENDSKAVSGSIINYIDDSIPTGTVMYFAASSAPTKWLYSDGSKLTKSVYSKLWNTIGYTFTPTNYITKSYEISGTNRTNVQNNATIGMDYYNNFIYLAYNDKIAIRNIITGHGSEYNYSFSGVTDVKVDKTTGNIYVADTSASCIKKYTNSTWSTLDTSSYGTIVPIYLYIKNDLLYVCCRNLGSGNILQFDLNGVYIKTINSIEGQFAVNSNNFIFSANTFGSNYNQIRRYDKIGTQDLIINIPNQGMNNPILSGISVDIYDNIYVSITDTISKSRIMKYSTNGELLFTSSEYNEVISGIICVDDKVICNSKTNSKLYINNTSYDPNTTYFNIPDLRADFIRGWDNSNYIDINRIFGSSQLDALKDHFHLTGAFLNNDDAYMPSTDITTSNIYNTYVTHGNGAFEHSNTNLSYNTTKTVLTILEEMGETRPRNKALLPCIKY